MSWWNNVKLPWIGGTEPAMIEIYTILLIFSFHPETKMVEMTTLEIFWLSGQQCWYSMLIVPTTDNALIACYLYQGSIIEITILTIIAIISRIMIIVIIFPLKNYIYHHNYMNWNFHNYIFFEWVAVWSQRS